MLVQVNGTAREINRDATVTSLLGEMNLAPIRVAVEVNEVLIPRKKFDQAVLREGDRVEIVTFVGGG